MSFRLRMAVAFTVLVAVLILAFSYLILQRSEALREAEFYQRLEDRAVLVEHLLVQARSLPVDEAEHLAQLLQEALPNEELVVLGTNGSVLFQRSTSPIDLPKSWREVASQRGIVRIARDDRQFVVVDRPETLQAGIRYTMTSAIDRSGLASMALLRRWVIGSGMVALLLTALLSWAYATWALAPVRQLVHQLGTMERPSERLQVNDTKTPDELDEVAIAFNGLLVRLDEAFEVQRSFMATASHELRTPLTVVRGELHLAKGLVEPNGPAERHLHAVEAQAVHMQDLLDQLLWLARTQVATAALLKDRVRLDEVAERAMERCAMRYPHVPVRFELDIADEVHEPVIMGSSVLLTAAVYNLLSNAAKYGGGTTVLLSLVVSPFNASFTVADDGPGMSAETLQRAKEMFFRAVDAPAMDGHGIGLTLVDRIVRVHGGRVTIRSGSGMGTSVVLDLPISQ
ncbi:MAG: HAMP domain-containing histidine kinase [Flavobacteriales bacterium]|nr:HAMP domain-containing histidine kinase [Flavobacteriales bacterium]